jgi:hypothetical protein
MKRTGNKMGEVFAGAMVSCPAQVFFVLGSNFLCKRIFRLQFMENASQCIENKIHWRRDHAKKNFLSLENALKRWEFVILMLLA